MVRCQGCLKTNKLIHNHFQLRYFMCSICHPLISNSIENHIHQLNHMKWTTGKWNKIHKLLTTFKHTTGKIKKTRIFFKLHWLLRFTKVTICAKLVASQLHYTTLRAKNFDFCNLVMPFTSNVDQPEISPNKKP